MKKLNRITKVITIITCISMLLSMSACSTTPKTLTLATTTSVNDSGLLKVLQPQFEKDTGITLKIIPQGSGQAIETAKKGDADVLLVHSKKAEEEFVSSGYGVKRVPFMYNYFVIVGPESDPAGLNSLADKTATAAFKSISDAKATFISRGDDSGTNKKELTIWDAAKIKPVGDWYNSTGKGMGDVLMMASEKQAYTLTDKATYLSMKDKLQLKILLENSKDLMNQYSVIAVNPDKNKNVNNKGAEEFIKWITSEKTLNLIADYGKTEYGEALFMINFGK